MITSDVNDYFLALWLALWGDYFLLIEIKGGWQLFSPFTLPGNFIQSYVKVLWTWLSPVSSPWTSVVTPHLHPPLLIPPPHPPPSPPTPAPLPNWEHLFTWVLSLDCKLWDFNLSFPEACLCLAVTPNLASMSSSSQPAETASRLSGPTAETNWPVLCIFLRWRWLQRMWLGTDFAFKFHNQFLHQKDLSWNHLAWNDASSQTVVPYVFTLP